MTRFLFFLFVPFFVCFSCSTKDVPNNVVPPQKMQAILWDLIRADELTGYRATLDTSIIKEKESIQLYAQILRIHNTSEEEFKRSFAYYEKNPEQLKTVLDSLRLRSEGTVPGAGFRRSID